MRKSKVVFLALILAVLAASGLLTLLDGQEDVVRFHQHREWPSQEELGTCSRHKEAGGEELCTHLPVIVIETGGQTVPGKTIMDSEGNILGYETTPEGEEEIQVTVKTIEKEGVWHHADDEPDIQSKALFRIRGNSSRRFAKSSYRIRLIQEDELRTNRDEPLLGMEADNEWALHGPFLDKTLIRNYMWMNLSAEVMGGAPDVRFCELVLEGEYQGVYVLMETNKVETGRVELHEYEEGDSVFSYLIRLESKINPLKRLDSFSFYTRRLETGAEVELLYPTASDQTEEVKQYVEMDFSEMERRLFSSEMIRDPDSCWEYLDLKSFGDYYILQEYLAVNDMFSRSTYFYKDVRGKLHIGPVWDYNNVLDNFFTKLPDDEFLLTQKGWYGQLMKSSEFVNYVIARYRQLRKGVLSEESVEQYALETSAWLQDAVERNFQVWGYSFDPEQLSGMERRHPSADDNQELTLEDLNPSSHEEAMEWMLDYAGQRGRWMDEHIEALLQYCHPSRMAAEQVD